MLKIGDNNYLNLGRAQVMAVLNLTPDSFSDGGTLFSDGHVGLDKVLRRAEQIVEEGGDWFDLGGESTRPGAQQVSSQQECDRVLPVLEALQARFELPISVDTSNPELMRAAASLGAAMINDVRALERPGALQAAADCELAVCLMHMQGQPSTMQAQPDYDNVVKEVSAYLQQRAQLCEAAGIDPQRILLDPGFGFGKTLQHNLQLFNGLPALREAGYPLLIGVSRKSMLGSILSDDKGVRPVDQRLMGGLALAAIAVQNGVAIIRTHDVQATRDVVDVLMALKEQALNRP